MLALLKGKGGFRTEHGPGRPTQCWKQSETAKLFSLLLLLKLKVGLHYGTISRSLFVALLRTLNAQAHGSCPNNSSGSTGSSRSSIVDVGVMENTSNNALDSLTEMSHIRSVLFTILSGATVPATAFAARRL